MYVFGNTFQPKRRKTTYPMRLILFIAFLLSFQIVYSQSNEPLKTVTTDSLEIQKIKATKKVYTTASIRGQSINIDGVMDDPAWNTVTWTGDFTQREPQDGGVATQQTAFKIVYDDKFLYVGYKCYDTEPDQIVKRLSRRDGFEGDWVEINIDGYLDKRTASSFTISAAGVKGDEAISNDGNNWDESFNPIWFAKVSSDAEGWSAEIKIPFSQLRFDKKDVQIWGFNVQRRHFRTNSQSSWQYISRDSCGWVSQFGELHGIKGVLPQKQVEIQPYVVASTETFEAEEGNPFRTGSKSDINVGLDGKVGIGNNYALDFTINPDFGQVDADPSVVALDGFQVFFDERRPFFIENRELFEMRLTTAETGGPFNSDNVFYSRRIGGAPHGYPRTNGFVDQPNFTKILGAAKFSGQTNDGLALGILQTVTREESAEISIGGESTFEVVEPLTSYTVARARQNLREGRSSVGGVFTSVQRDMADSDIGIHKSAYSGAVDFLHTWKDRNYYLKGNVLLSHVSGTKETIFNTQNSFEHLFQRVDADHLDIDPDKTNLTGSGATIQYGKNGGENWYFDTGLTYRSPELELNDIGFLRSTDYVAYFGWAQYRDIIPKGKINALRINYNHWSNWNFAGEHIYGAINVNAHVTFKNFWRMGMNNHFELKDLSATSLRGGPMLRTSSGWGKSMYVSSNFSKKFAVNLNAFNFSSFQKGESNSTNYNLYVTYQPSNSLNISMGPSYNINNRPIQYVTNIKRNGNSENTRYINGTIDQETFSMSIRLNYTIKPNLTIQYWGQPFISKAQYSEFKYITDSRAKTYQDRYITYGPDQITYESGDGRYHIDEDIDGTNDYSFRNPDFNFIQFRSNLVARWEYIPGSELFLVWSQGLTNSGNPSDNLFPSLVDNVFDNKADNIFLMKLTYRFIK